jgi:hypothetical protein
MRSLDAQGIDVREGMPQLIAGDAVGTATPR